MTRDDLTAYLSSLDDVTHERVAGLIACYRAMPDGFDALVRVLELGARKHNGGDLGVAPKWTAGACLEHAADHVTIAREGGPYCDEETGELHIAHAAARLVMAVQIVHGHRWAVEVRSETEETKR